MELRMPHPHVVVENVEAEHCVAGYLRLLLSRPGRRNALDPGMVRAMLEAFRAEALRLGLLHRVDDQPEQVAADLAGTLLARRAGALAKTKIVTSAGGLLDRLHAERDANRAVWARAPLSPDPG
jgi:enoyl-CoA hydratase/carnithine racemase